MRHFEESKIILASPTAVFEIANDHRNFSSHMNKSSPMMVGSKMETSTDENNGQKIDSHIYMEGQVLGFKLFLDEIVTLYDPPYKKVWQSVGKIRLLIIGHYKMGFEIIPENNYSILRVFIDYSLPNSIAGKKLGSILAGPYARWCVHQMIFSVLTNFTVQKRNSMYN